jgi:predicted RNA-binding protein (virulence factor B family)
MTVAGPSIKMPTMVDIGRINKLQIIKEVDFGLYLDGGDDGQILLPLNEMPDAFHIGDWLDVFIGYDSEDRLIAATKLPLAMVGDFAVLKVVAIERVGAFLDWGLPKDLFLPFGEQTRDLRVGEVVIVFIYLDRSDRITASMRLQKNIDPVPGDYQVGQSVQLVIAGKTELGHKAIVEGRHWGVLFENEVFQNLNYGQILDGFIKQVRPDGKIDLSLTPPGSQDTEDLPEQILNHLKEKGGFSSINDKTPAETIYEIFRVSKKKYKIALGGLYKKRLITIHDDGIRLV